MSDKELQEKRAKGLCFRCDDKWNVGHRCKKRELGVLLLEGDDEDGVDDSHSELPPSPTEELSPEVSLHPEVSLNSVVGLSNPRTMKLRGKVGGAHEVIVLIDPGATHNFVSLAKVAALKLPVSDSGGFSVSLSNGKAVKGSGVCEGVLLELTGGLIIEEDFLPLDLGTTYMILGVQWLEKLGVVVTNWKSQIMQFTVGTNIVTLAVDPSLTKSKISVKTMIKTIRKQKQAFIVEVNKLEAPLPEVSEPAVPEFVAEIVTRHGSLFIEPSGLPPVHGHEHRIILKEGGNLVGARPYRYQQSQKDEIERLIQEMLSAGIIKPSTSPYSSPVLLVCNKDG